MRFLVLPAGLAVAAVLLPSAHALTPAPATATVRLKLPGVVVATRSLQYSSSTTAVTTLTGSVRLTRGRRTVTLTALRLRTSARTVALTARVRGIRRTLAEGTPKGYAPGPPPSLRSTPVKLTRTGARTLNTALKLRLRPGARAATVSVTPPRPPDRPGATTSPTGTATTPATSTTTVPTTPAPDPFAASCPIQESTGGFTIGSPTPAPAEPVISGSAATPTTSWGFKQSFRDYVNASAPASSAFAVAPATGTFTFPGASGTVTDPEAGPIRAVLHGTGTAVFCHRAHGFRISLANPAVVLDGGASYLSAEVGSNAGGTVQPAVRARVATLDLSGVSPVYDSGARTVTWTDVPAVLHGDVAAVFGGFYPTGAALDPVTVVAQL